MATPRKHWFRVADSVGVEPWSNDVLATCIRLQAALNTRWARDGRAAADASSIVCRPGELMALTGSASLVRARRIARALAAHVSLTVLEDGQNTRLEWPKWADFQGLNARESPDSRPKVAPEMPSPHPHPHPPPQDASSRTPHSPPAGGASLDPPEADAHEPRSSPEAIAPATATPLDGQGEDPHPAEPLTSIEAKRSVRDAMRLAWSAMTAAFQRHGRDPTAWRLTPERQRMIRARLADGFMPADFAAAVDGYRLLHGQKSNGHGDFDADKFFRPDTLLRASKFAGYVEQARASPARKPWQRDPDQPLPPKV